MAQSKKKTSFEKILKLVEGLSTDDQERLRAKLNSKSKAERWLALTEKVKTQCESLPPLTEADVLTDLKEIRNEMKAERAQSSN